VTAPTHGLDALVPEATAPRRRPRASAAVAPVAWCAVALVALAWSVGAAAGFRIGLAALTAVAFAAAAAGLWRPVVGLFGAGLLCTLDTVAGAYLLTGGLLRWNTFGYLLLGVIALNVPLLLAVRSLPMRLFQAFAALLAVEIVISPDWVAGVQVLLEVVAYLGLVVYFVRAGARPAAWRWLGVVCGLAGALGGLVFLLQRSTLPPINANAWAYFPLTALFAVCLAFPFAQAQRRHRVTLAVLGGVDLAWVFLSGSRGALLTGVPCVLFLLVVTRGIGWRTGLAAGAVALAVVVSSTFGDLQGAALRRLRLLTATEAALETRTSHRSVLVVGGWRLFTAQPFGVGTGGFAASWRGLGRQPGLPAWGRGSAKAAHAGWIKLLVENGVPGAALFGAFVLAFAATGLRRRQREWVALGLLVTGVLTAALATTEYQNKGLWFLAAGVTALPGVFHARRRRRRRLPR
jgi:hypothetical protein